MSTRFYSPKVIRVFSTLPRGAAGFLRRIWRKPINEYQGKGWKFVLAESIPIASSSSVARGADVANSVLDHTALSNDTGATRNAERQWAARAACVLHRSREVLRSEELRGSYPPTNIQVDFVVKERMGEFFAGMHDIWLSKHPKTWWLEFAWSSDGCGQPCPNEPLIINEILTLGGDVFEQSVPDEESNPKLPPMTDSEKPIERSHKTKPSPRIATS